MLKPMLLSPDKVNAFKQTLLNYFIQNLAEPFNNETCANRLVEKALRSIIQVWALLRQPDDSLVGFATTSIIEDFFTGERVVWIITLNSNNTVTDDEWDSAFKYLGAWAKMQGCSKISCQTRDDKLANLAERRGMTQSFKYFDKEV